MKLVVIDNFDSFTYNLVQLLAELGAQVVVERNNVDLQRLIDHQPQRLVISPGPGRPPKDTGVTCAAIGHFAGQIPILGVCLGHQAIGHVFGGRIVAARQLMHGKASQVFLDDKCPIFKNLPDEIRAGRYHSLVVEHCSMPACLEIVAGTGGFEDEEEVMAIQHRQLPHVYGIQFHPESLLTARDMQRIQDGAGVKILANFLAL